MAIDGTSTKITKFWDEETQQFVQVNLSVRDIIYFKLLQRLERSIRGIKLQT